MTKNRLLAVGLIAVIIIVAIASTSIYYFGQQNSYTPAIPLEGAGASPDFTLVDQNGEQFTFSTLKGKVVLISFGYVHCPDICPIIMQKYSTLAKSLGDDIDKVAMLMVTTDPARDNPNALKEYLKIYDSRIIGLTGTFEDVEEVWHKYQIPVEIEEHEHDDDHYLVSHFSLVLVTDEDLIQRFAFTPEMVADEYIDGVRYLLG